MTFGSFPPQIRHRVVVTGLGAITPLGNNVSSTWAALCKGKSGTKSLREVPFFYPSCLENNSQLSPEVKKKQYEQLIEAMPCQVAAPVISTPGGPNFAPTSRETRATVFAHHAVQEALLQAGLINNNNNNKTQKFISNISMDRVGVNIGVGMPSLADVGDVSYNLYADSERIQYSRVNPFFVPKILGNMLAGLTAIKYNITGPIGSSVAACATGAHCISEAAEWIRTGKADIVICGAAESCITPVSIAGFSRMRALCTKYNKTPSLASRPFDKKRGGFIMGEGAGVMILESLSFAKQRKASIIVELRGIGLSSDAYDVAAPHPDGRGAQLCIHSALKDAGNIFPTCVSYVNAHATGTIGDDVELQALQNVLGSSNNNNKEEEEQPLFVSSVKGGIGHLLGAAGSVEAIVAIIALQKQQAPPNINLETPTFETEKKNKEEVDNVNNNNNSNEEEQKKKKRKIKLIQGNAPQSFKGDAVISTSFGFGGINTALLFTQVKDT